MRSKLSNEIFHDEMLSLYQQKDLSYQQVRDTAIEAMGRLIRRWKQVCATVRSSKRKWKRWPECWKTTRARKSTAT